MILRQETEIFASKAMHRIFFLFCAQQVKPAFSSSFLLEAGFFVGILSLEQHVLLSEGVVEAQAFKVADFGCDYKNLLVF